MFSKIIIKKKPKRSLNTIGEDFYHFDYNHEELIYKYVCYRQLKKKELEKINDNERFDSYLQWKQYICNKYKDFPKSKLANFSRYLNQRIKYSKPYKEYTPILITVFLTWFITALLNTLVEGKALSDLSLWGKIFYLILAFIFILNIPYKMLGLMCDDNFEENLLIDYKEIIDEMLNDE